MNNLISTLVFKTCSFLDIKSFVEFSQMNRLYNDYLKTDDAWKQLCAGHGYNLEAPRPTGFWKGMIQNWTTGQATHTKMSYVGLYPSRTLLNDGTPIEISRVNTNYDKFPVFQHYNFRTGITTPLDVAAHLGSVSPILINSKCINTKYWAIMNKAGFVACFRVDSGEFVRKIDSSLQSESFVCMSLHENELLITKERSVEVWDCSDVKNLPPSIFFGIEDQEEENEEDQTKMVCSYPTENYIIYRNTKDELISIHRKELTKKIVATATSEPLCPITTSGTHLCFCPNYEYLDSEDDERDSSYPYELWHETSTGFELKERFDRHQRRLFRNKIVTFAWSRDKDTQRLNPGGAITIRDLYTLQKINKLTVTFGPLCDHIELNGFAVMLYCTEIVRYSPQGELFAESSFIDFSPNPIPLIIPENITTPRQLTKPHEEFFRREGTLYLDPPPHPVDAVHAEQHEEAEMVVDVAINLAELDINIAEIAPLILTTPPLNPPPPSLPASISPPSSRLARAMKILSVIVFLFGLAVYAKKRLPCNPSWIGRRFQVFRR